MKRLAIQNRRVRSAQPSSLRICPGNVRGIGVSYRMPTFRLYLRTQSYFTASTTVFHQAPLNGSGQTQTRVNGSPVHETLQDDQNFVGEPPMTEEQKNERLIKMSEQLLKELEKGYKLPDLLTMIHRGHPETSSWLRLLMILIGKDKGMMEEIDSHGGVQVIMGLLRSENLDWRLNAIRLLGALATSNIIRPKVAEPYCVNRLCSLLESAKDDESIIAITMALRNIAAYGRAGHDMLDCRIIPKVLSLLDSNNSAIQESSVGIIMNMSTHNDMKLALGRAGVIPALFLQIENDNPVISKLAILALTNLSVNDNAQIQFFDSAGGIFPLVNTLRRTDDPEVQNAIGILISFLGSKLKNQILLREVGGIPLLLSFLKDNPTGPTSKLAFLAALRNLVSGNDINKVVVRQEGGIQILMNILKSPSNVNAQDAVAVAGTLYNLASDAKNRALMHSEGIIDLILSFMGANEMTIGSTLQLDLARILPRIMDHGEPVHAHVIEPTRLKQFLSLIMFDPNDEVKLIVYHVIITAMQGPRGEELRRILEVSQLPNHLAFTIENSVNDRILSSAATLARLIDPSAGVPPADTLTANQMQRS